MAAPWHHGQFGCTSEPFSVEYNGEPWGFVSNGFYGVFFQAPGVEWLPPLPTAGAANVGRYFDTHPVSPVTCRAGEIQGFAGDPVWPVNREDAYTERRDYDRCIVCGVPVNAKLLAQAVAFLPPEVEVQVGPAPLEYGRGIVVHAAGFRAVLMGLASDGPGREWPPRWTPNGNGATSHADPSQTETIKTVVWGEPLERKPSGVLHRLRRLVGR